MVQGKKNNSHCKVLAGENLDVRIGLACRAVTGSPFKRCTKPAGLQ